MAVEYPDPDPNAEPGLMIRPPAFAPEPTYTKIPTTLETAKAAFETNWLVALGRRMYREEYPAQIGYRVMDDLRGTIFAERYSDNFLSSRSPEETLSIKRRIIEENEINETLEAAGNAGTIWQFGTSLMDPTIALPAGRIIKVAGGGYSTVRSIRSVGGAGAVQASAAEIGLQAGMETRTWQESALAIGSGTLFAGFIGAGASKLASRTQLLAGAAKLDIDRANTDLHAGTITPAEHAQRVGAAYAQIRKAGEPVPDPVPGAGVGRGDRIRPAPESVAAYVDDYEAGLGRNSPAHLQYAANNAAAIEAEFARRKAATQPIEPVPVAPASGAVPGAAAVPGAPGAAAVPGEAVPGAAVAPGAEVVPGGAPATLGAPEAPRLGPTVPPAAADAIPEPPPQPPATVKMPPELTGPLAAVRWVDDLMAGRVWDSPAHIKFAVDHADEIRNEIARRERTAEAAPAGRSAGVAAAGGAAATDVRQLELLPAMGVEKIPLGPFGAPTRKVLQAKSVVGRRWMAAIAEFPYLFYDNLNNIATAPVAAVDRLVRMVVNSNRVLLSDELIKAYSDYRFGERVLLPGARDQWQRLTTNVPEDVLSFAQFKHEVGLASMTEGGKHDLPQVTAVARYYHDVIQEPWGKRAEETEGLGFKRLEPHEGEWHFPHLWLVPKIMQDPNGFTRHLVDVWFKPEQAKKFAAQERLKDANDQLQSLGRQINKLAARIQRIDVSGRDLSIRLDERAMEVRRLDKRAGIMEERSSLIGEEISEAEEFIASMREDLKDPDLLTRLDEMEANLRELRKLDKPMTEAQLRALEEEELGGILTGTTRLAAEIITGKRSPPKPKSFVRYLAGLGGIKDEGGNVLSILGGQKKNAPGLIREAGGKTIQEIGEQIQADFPAAFPDTGTTGSGVPQPRQILDWITDALGERKQQPDWFERGQATNDLALAEADALAKGLEEVFSRAGILEDLKTPRDVARVLRDEMPGGVTLRDLDRIAAEMEAAQGAIPPGVRVEDQAARIAEVRDQMFQVRRVIQDAQAASGRKATQQRTTDIRTGEARHAERANLGRLGVLDERLTAKQRRRELMLDYLEVAQTMRDEVRAKIEKDIAAFEGKSTVDAQARLKAREKADALRTPEQKEKQPRLTSADDAVDKAVKRIIEDPERYDLDDEALIARAERTRDRIVNTPDGRLPYDEAVGTGGTEVGWKPNSSTEPPRGSLAHRAMNIPNELIKDWIETDIERVAHANLRTMVPDILLTERTGDVRMTRALTETSEDYNRMIREAEANVPLPGEKPRTKPQIAAEIKQLLAEKAMVIEQLAGVRDRVRGVYGWSPGLRYVARAAVAAKQVNNVVSMGSSMLASLSDMSGIMNLYGFRSVLNDGWQPYLQQIMRNTDVGTDFRHQMHAMGIGVESKLNARQHSIDDIMDGAAPQSKFERALAWGNDKFFIANLLAPFTDELKHIAAHVVMSNILRASEAVAKGTATKVQLRNLLASNITPEMATRIHGEFLRPDGGIRMEGNVLLPNTATWKDQQLAETFAAAVNREADIGVMTPGQEKSLWMSQPVLGILGQFKGFTQAAHERILIGNLQRRDANTLQGLVFSIMLGMLSYKLTSFFGGRETSERPQDWIKEGISRSGVTGWFEEGNAIASKLTNGSVDMYRGIGADRPTSRFASRSAADMLLGPTYGKIETMRKIIGAGAGAIRGDKTKGDLPWGEDNTHALRTLNATQNVFYLNFLWTGAERGINSAFGIPMKERP